MLVSLRAIATAAVLTLGLLAPAQFPGVTQAPPADLRRGWDSITVPQAKEILTFLATECEGRGSGQPGFRKAADFVARHFKAWGLKPMGDHGTYFQDVPYQVSRFEEAGSSIGLLGESKPIPAGAAFRMTQLPSALDLTAPVAVVRNSGDASELDRATLRGKIVLLYEDRYNSNFQNALNRANPAVVLQVVKRVPSADYDSARIGGGLRRGGRVPSGVITEAAATELVSALNLTDASTTPGGDLPIRVSHAAAHLKANLQTQTVYSPNVVAMLPGSDPSLATEFVGIGGHLDHLGKRGAVVYPGADDDGSGSTAVLSIAHAMATNPKKPKRSILFMTFSGEELGLVGSTWLTDHPMIPLNKMVAELQMDMVARDSYGPQNGDQRRIDVESQNRDTIRLVGSKRISTDLDKAVQEANRSIGFQFKYDAEDVYERSDHYNFAKHGIPIAFLFDGFTPDYHQPSDTVDKIDWLKLTNSAKLFYLTAYAVADNPTPPVHDVH